MVDRAGSSPRCVWLESDVLPHRAQQGRKLRVGRLVRKTQGIEAAPFFAFCSKRMTAGPSCVGSRLTKASRSLFLRVGSALASCCTASNVDQATGHPVGSMQCA